MKTFLLIWVLLFMIRAEALFAQENIAAGIFGTASGLSSNEEIRLFGTLGEVVSGAASNSSGQVLSGFWNSYQNSVITFASEQDLLPAIFAMEQNYPNPFNPVTTIRYSIPKESFVTLKVFNFLGQQIAQLLDAKLEAGYHEVVFDGSGLSSGVYFYRIIARDYTQSKKMLLLK